MKIILVMFTILFGYQASAIEFQFDISSLILKSGTLPKARGVCYIPELTSQQSYLYAEIHILHFSDTKEMRTLLEKQKRAYKNILHNRKIQTKGFADDIAKKYFSTKYNLSKYQMSFFHAVLYKILLKKQRDDLLKCL